MKRVFKNLIFVLLFLPHYGQAAGQNLKIVSYDYIKDIKPIFETRCVQCHACVQSPCGLNFSSEDGIRRGMITNYNTGNAGRIKSYHPSRLGIDATRTSQWHDGSWKKTEEKSLPRKLIDYAGRIFSSIKSVEDEEFFPVVPLPSEISSLSASNKPKDNFIAQLVRERQSNASPILDHKYFGELQSENSRVCPKTTSALKEHIEDRVSMGTSAGMPYGLPALSDLQIKKLEAWIKNGAPMPEEGKRLPKVAKQFIADLPLIRRIERFFNKSFRVKGSEKKKRKLVSRYIFEHLFQSSIYLTEGSQSRPQFYTIVRKNNKCTGPNAEIIASLRPWEAYKPVAGKADQIYYCLEPIEKTITHKNHITYKIDDERLYRWEKLFFENENWEVKYNWKEGLSDRIAKIEAIEEIRGNSKRIETPQKIASMNPIAPRDDAHAANPFIAFKDIPVAARYQFLLDDSRYFVRSFIRGPVCKGSTATNSIDEQFYVLFLKPEMDPMVINPRVEGKDFATASENLLDLPATFGSEGDLLKPKSSIDFVSSLRVSRNKYRSLRQKAYEKTNPTGYKISDLWDGQGPNDFNIPNTNSNLSVFRNFNSAAVEQGLIGPTSKTIFVLDYSILERLYYLLVSGYDVYADLNHQVTSRLYMSYLRMEAEELFLNFLPSKIRKPMRDYWNTPGSGITENSLKNKVDLFYPLVGEHKETGEDYFTNSGGVVIDNEAQILSEGRKATKKITDFAFDYRASSGNKKDMTIYESYRDLYYVLSLYRQEFVYKTIRHIGASRGYKDKFSSFENRYSDIDSPITTKHARSFADLEKLFSQLNGRPARYQPWVYLMPSVSHLVVDDKSTGKSELYTFIRQKEHFNVNWLGGEEGRRVIEDDNIIIYKGILGSYPNMIFRFDLSDSKDFVDSLLELSMPEDGLISPDYQDFIATFGLPRTGPGSERFWAGYDHLIKIYKQKEPIEAGVLDLNRYGLDYMHTDVVSFTKKKQDPGVVDKFLENLMKKIADLYVESYVE